MTEYAYKLVSISLGGQLDWLSIEKARKRGWEPVPLGEEPTPAVNPLDMAPEQLANFKLCRMPLDRHQEMTEELEFLNAALADPRVHKLIAIGNIEKWIEEHALDVADQNRPENALEVAVYSNQPPPENNPALLYRRVEVAYAWLRDRGMA